MSYLLKKSEKNNEKSVEKKPIRMVEPIIPPQEIAPKIEKKPQKKLGILEPYKTDLEDAVDTWLKAYKKYNNDKTVRQRERMKKIMELLATTHDND